MQDAGKLWGELSTEEKQKFTKIANKQKQDYQEYIAKSKAFTNENGEQGVDKVEEE